MIDEYDMRKCKCDYVGIPFQTFLDFSLASVPRIIIAQKARKLCNSYEEIEACKEQAYERMFNGGNFSILLNNRRCWE